MPANYDYKMTDKEFEVMMLKKQLKEEMKNNKKGKKGDVSTHNDSI
jgi:hypothetical protein